MLETEKINGLKRKKIMNKHQGNHFDDFLSEQDLLEETTALAHKQLLVLQLKDIMTEKNISKTSLAQQLKTSRSQLDRILDPTNISITLEILDRVAHAVGKKLQIGLN